MSGQLHVLTALPPEKEPSTYTGPYVNLNIMTAKKYFLTFTGNEPRFYSLWASQEISVKPHTEVMSSEIRPIPSILNMTAENTE
jgi:hypothetical protein